MKKCLFSYKVHRIFVCIQRVCITPNLVMAFGHDAIGGGFPNSDANRITIGSFLAIERRDTPAMEKKVNGEKEKNGLSEI